MSALCWGLEKKLAEDVIFGFFLTHDHATSLTEMKLN